MLFIERKIRPFILGEEGTKYYIIIASLLFVLVIYAFILSSRIPHIFIVVLLLSFLTMISLPFISIIINKIFCKMCGIEYHHLSKYQGIISEPKDSQMIKKYLAMHPYLQKHFRKYIRMRYTFSYYRFKHVYDKIGKASEFSLV